MQQNKENISLSKMSEQQFSDEDQQLLQEYRLGYPLRIYRLRPGYILFHRLLNLFAFILSSIGIWLIVTGLPRLYRDLSIGVEILLWSGGFVFVLAMAWYVWTMCRHEEQSKRFLVGEDGLLKIRNMPRRDRIDVLHWNEVRGIRTSFFSPASVCVPAGRGASLPGLGA